MSQSHVPGAAAQSAGSRGKSAKVLGKRACEEEEEEESGPESKRQNTAIEKGATVDLKVVCARWPFDRLADNTAVVNRATYRKIGAPVVQWVPENPEYRVHGRLFQLYVDASKHAPADGEIVLHHSYTMIHNLSVGFRTVHDVPELESVTIGGMSYARSSPWNDGMQIWLQQRLCGWIVHAGEPLDVAERHLVAHFQVKDMGPVVFARDGIRAGRIGPCTEIVIDGQ